MKKNFYKAVFFGIITTVSVSCSSDDSAPKEEDNPTPGVEAKYVHKVLVEDATGTWCQYCPRVSYAIEQAKSNEKYGNNVVAVAVHLGIQQYPDQMQIGGVIPLYNFYQSTGLTGFPYALINRTSKWSTPEPNNLAQLFNTISEEGSPVGIKISSDLNNNGGSVSVNFKFSEGYEDLKYSVFIIEHDVLTPQSPQQNTTGYYGGVRVDANFVHQDVLRGFSGVITGNELGSVTPGEEISKTDQSVSFTLFNNDLSKVEVVAFVSDSSGKVLNVQSAKANQNVDYQTM